MIAGLEKRAALVFGEKKPSSFEDKNLGYEVEYLSFLNWWKDSQGRFDNLSFRINNQVQLFLTQLIHGRFEEGLSQLRTDLYGYYLEYIRQDGIIPFSLIIRNDGKITGEFYGEKDIVEIVDEKEREGAVKKAMIDLKEKLKKLGDDEIIFRISPAGWTGFDYQYAETQSQVIWKDRNNPNRIRGVTIRSQISLDRIVEILQENFGIDVPSSSKDEKELIKYITSLNLTLPYSPEIFLEILTDFFENKDHQGRNLATQISNWQKNDGQFFYFDQIADAVSFIEEKIKDLLYQGLPEDLVKEKLSSLIGFVLMLMGADNLKQKEKDRLIFEGKEFYETRLSPEYFYDKVYDHLQSLPGCAGGGNIERRNFMMSLFGPTEISSE
ncbi:MAG: hypothetical protein QW076_04250, partial [Candidatus Anstonellales archaeon]